MSQLSTSYPWKQAMKTSNNHSTQHPISSNRSESTSAFVMYSHRYSSDSGSPPLPPHLPPPLLPTSVPHQIHRQQINAKHGSPSTSRGSTTDSNGNAPVKNSQVAEQRRALPHGASPRTSALTNEPIPNSDRYVSPPVPPHRRMKNPTNSTGADPYEQFRDGTIQTRVFARDPKVSQPQTKPGTVRKKQKPSSAPQVDYYGYPKVKVYDEGYRPDGYPAAARPAPPIQFQKEKRDSIGLEITEPTPNNRRQPSAHNDNHWQSPAHNDNRYYPSGRTQRAPTLIEAYELEEEEEDQQKARLPHDRFPANPYRPAATMPPISFTRPYPQHVHQPAPPPRDAPVPLKRMRHLPMPNIMVQVGALLVVAILCMVLVLAIREDANGLRTISQCVYIYIYGASVIWMLWCTFDIIKFRRQWTKITESAASHEDYMHISAQNTHTLFYFPDKHNTGGLFMRIGAGLLCMGGLILTVIELGKTIATIDAHSTTRIAPQSAYSSSVMITKAVFFVLRFVFHCVQFMFLFRYGNLIINRHHSYARTGLIHVVIANFCTWFEAIVIETLEQIHKSQVEISAITSSYSSITTSTTTIFAITDNNTSNDEIPFDIVRAGPHDSNAKNSTVLHLLRQIEETMSVYLYPCLIEYSLISLTVFFIMWRNVGKIQNRSVLGFGARHIFTVNCARASRGLLVGGIIFLLTVLTLIPTYLLQQPDSVTVTHTTELVLLVVSLLTVWSGFIHTTMLYYDKNAHVDAFDHGLILLTTVGDFAYSCFGILAALLIEKEKAPISTGVEAAIGFLSILQTFSQTIFISDTLKRRVKTKSEIKSKPGRELVTALLLMNLAIWLHDSLSAKKVRLNPLQTLYYDTETWAIVQAFTSPLSIFYRFHSSVCLADIWQEVFQESEHEDKH